MSYSDRGRACWHSRHTCWKLAVREHASLPSCPTRRPVCPPRGSMPVGVAAFSFSSTVSPPSPSAALCRCLLLQQHCVAAFSFSSTVSPPSSAALCTGAVRPTPPSEPGCCLSASVLLVVRQNRSPGVSRCRFTDLRRVVFDGAVVQGDPSTHSTRSPISTNQRR